jgi:hypothetical protein
MKPNRNHGITLQDIGKEMILYRKEDKAIHVLNQTARVIWDLCDGLHSLDDIEQALRERFTIPDHHDVAGDVQRTLATFQEKGLLQPDTETVRD